MTRATHEQKLAVFIVCVLLVATIAIGFAASVVKKRLWPGKRLVEIQRGDRIVTLRFDADEPADKLTHMTHLGESLDVVFRKDLMAFYRFGSGLPVNQTDVVDANTIGDQLRCRMFVVPRPSEAGAIHEVDCQGMWELVHDRAVDVRRKKGETDGGDDANR